MKSSCRPLRRKAGIILLFIVIRAALAAAGAPPPPAAGRELVDPGFVLPQAITLGKADAILAGARPAEVKLNGKPLTASVPIGDCRAYFFVLPVSYASNQARISIKADGVAIEKSIVVLPHENSVKDVPSIILPDAAAGITTNKENHARIAAEDKRIREILAVRSPRQFELPFAYPLPEPVVTSSFGKKRDYYDARKKFLYSSYHLGLDLRAAKGTPVLSTAAGTVLLAQSTLVRGNVVYVDHGLGIISAYMHLDRLDVKEGQRVERGTPLGGAGTTGVSTGVHLHWSVYIEGINADGGSLVDLDTRLEAAGKMLAPVQLPTAK